MAETQVTTRIQQVDVGDVALSVTTAGLESPGRPAVVLLHGFAGIGYSWRHQIRPLAAAGYAVLAPDQRGSGWSKGVPEPTPGDVSGVVRDVRGLLDAFEIDRAVVIGHGHGAVVGAHLAIEIPGRLVGLGLLSEPFDPNLDNELVQRAWVDEPDTDPIGALRRLNWMLCGDHPDDDQVPRGLPPHIEPGEFENYCRAYARSGFAQTVAAAAAAWPEGEIHVPAVRMTGERDPVANLVRDASGTSVAGLSVNCADLRGAHMISGVGHWLQQEAPGRTTDLLVEFLGQVMR